MVFAECPQDKEDLMIQYSIREEKIKIIPCGFDSSEFYPINQRKARLKLGLDPDGIVVLQLGRMVKRKGIDNVILAMSSLIKKSAMSVQLVIVGGESNDPDPLKTPEIGRLQQIAIKEKIYDKVKFIGRRTREELKYYYNAANVFVTTPWYEPFGITPLEAMACGTPVIGANVGGIKYSIEHGKTGFLVPPNDPEILCERLMELLMDPVLKRRFSLEALKRVNSLFTWDIVSNKINELYEQIIPERIKSGKKLQEPFYGFFGYGKITKSEKKLT
jgi:glycosyltransferase involved in cell wall biosynthesis